MKAFEVKFGQYSLKNVMGLPIIKSRVNFCPRSVVDSTRDSGSLRVGSNPVEGVPSRCYIRSNDFFYSLILKNTVKNMKINDN